MEGGVNPNFLLARITKTKTNLSTNKDKVNGVESNVVKFVGNAGVGVEYKWKDRINIFNQINYRYHFTKSNKKTLINENLYELGLEVGLRYKI